MLPCFNASISCLLCFHICLLWCFSWWLPWCFHILLIMMLVMVRDIYMSNGSSIFFCIHELLCFMPCEMYFHASCLQFPEIIHWWWWWNWIHIRLNWRQPFILYLWTMSSTHTLTCCYHICFHASILMFILTLLLCRLLQSHTSTCFWYFFCSKLYTIWPRMPIWIVCWSAVM
jgi:hypothetical protein